MAHPLARYKYYSPILHTIMKYVTTPWYYFLNLDFVRFLVNVEAMSKYEQDSMNLTGVQREIIAEVKRNGIAFSSLEELGGNLEELQKYAATLESVATQNTRKSFLVSLFPRYGMEIDFSNPFVSWILTPTVLKIAAGYLGMWPKFKYMDLSITIPSEGERSRSQVWHRDYDDRALLKMFIYLNDVGEDQGPFEYVKGSQYGGQFASVLPPKYSVGAYDTQSEVDALTRPGQIKCTGKAGTVIFADTGGLHRGGYAKEGRRVMFTCAYGMPTNLYVVDHVYTPTFKKEIQEKEDITQYAV